jgi:outer membrane immunogenic protein
MARHFAMAVLTGVITLTTLGAANAQAPANWTGPYVGGLVGSSFATTPGSSASFIAGGFLGWNVQAGQTVLGIEGDLAWMASRNWSWESSVRGRFGVLMNPWTLLYGTGGAAFARVRGDGFAADWSSKSGYTVGGGLETAALFAGAKARLEYRYTDLGSLDGCAGSTTIAPAGCNTRASFQSVTLGLSVPLAAGGVPGRRVVK